MVHPIVTKFISMVSSLPTNISIVNPQQLTEPLKETLRKNSVIVLSATELLTPVKLTDIFIVLNGTEDNEYLELRKLINTAQTSTFIYILLHVLYISNNLLIEGNSINLKDSPIHINTSIHLNTCGDVIELLPKLQNQGCYHYPSSNLTILYIDSRKKGVIQELLETTFMKKKIEMMKLERIRANSSDISKIIGYLDLIDELKILKSSLINKYKHQLHFLIGPYSNLNNYVRHGKYVDESIEIGIMNSRDPSSSDCDGAWTPDDC